MTPQDFCLWLDKYLESEGKNVDTIEEVFAKVNMYDTPLQVKGFFPSGSNQSPTWKVH